MGKQNSGGKTRDEIHLKENRRTTMKEKQRQQREEESKHGALKE